MEHLDISHGGKDYSVFYEDSFVETGKSECQVCGCFEKGHKELMEIEEIVDANSMIPVEMAKKPMLVKSIERKVKAYLKKTLCLECASDTAEMTLRR